MRTILLTLLLSVLTACQTSKVTVDYDTGANFSDIQHYAWLTETSGTESGFDPLLADRVRNAVEANLRAIPLTPAVGSTPADILVRYYIGSHTRAKESNSRGSIGLGGGGGNVGMGIGLSFPLGGEKIVKEAQIFVDFVDPATQKLKWRGTNLIRIGDESPVEITAMINTAVAEIFSHYPPEKSDK